jgi:hypothetical protein
MGIRDQRLNDPDLRTKSTRPVGQVRAENPVRLLPGRIWYRRPRGGCGVGPNPSALDAGEVPRLIVAVGVMA